MKILAVFNTCGILPGDRSDLWIKHIDSIFQQSLSSGIELYVVLSDCLSSIEIRQKLQNYYQDRIAYSFINEKIPVNPTFNKAVLECVKHSGYFDGYIYVDSGIEFNNKNIIDILCGRLQTNKYGIISAIADTDSSLEHGNINNTTKDNIINVGGGINLHCALFSNEYFQFYHKLMPDIFSGWCSESVLSFCCAAIKKQWLVAANTEVRHVCNVDGQSIGFRPPEYTMRTGVPYWNHPYIIDNLIPIFTNPKALSLGLGYEECQRIVMHDPSQYDENQHCINDELKYYIKDNLFLSKELLDYDKITGEFIP